MTPFRLERLVAGTVFWRFFESGLVPPGVSPALVLIWLVAFLATPGYLMSLEFALSFGGSDPTTMLDRLLTPALLLIVLSMMAMGFLALWMWESAYPDRRDARTFGPIGLGNRTLVLGRLAALGAVAATVSAGMSAPSSIVFGLVLLQHGAASNILQAIAGHFVATASAGLFVFFLVLATQGSLLLLFGATIAQRVAIVLQTAIVVCLFEAMRLLPRAADEMRLVFEGGGTAQAVAFPPTWFIALHSYLIGRPALPPAHYVWLAIAATTAVVLLSVLFLASMHKRVVPMALETTGHRRTRETLISRLLDGILAHSRPTPSQRATAAFTVRTMTRSRPHLLVFAACFGVAVALTSATLMAAVGFRDSESSTFPRTALLSVPLVLSFVMLCAGRALFGVPVDTKGNWIFRLLANNGQLPELIDGARTGLILLVVLPVTLVAAVSVLPSGLLVSAGHAGFTAIVATLLVDILVFRLRNIPFAAAYRPGGARIGSLWPLYLTAFTFYCYSLATVETWLLSRPVALATFIGLAFTASLLFARCRHADLAPPRQLEYDAIDADQLFQGFGFSEALAAHGDRGIDAHPTHPTNVTVNRAPPQG